MVPPGARKIKDEPDLTPELHPVNGPPAAQAGLARHYGTH
jgi:hypothetical protein